MSEAFLASDATLARDPSEAPGPRRLRVTPKVAIAFAVIGLYVIAALFAR
jgi:hypothetical protein